MLRMNRSPSSRVWTIWDDQDLVAVVVDKQGATERLRRFQAHASPPTPAAAAGPGERQRGPRDADSKVHAAERSEYDNSRSPCRGPGRTSNLQLAAVTRG